MSIEGTIFHHSTLHEAKLAGPFHKFIPKRTDLEYKVTREADIAIRARTPDRTQDNYSRWLLSILERGTGRGQRNYLLPRGFFLIGEAILLLMGTGILEDAESSLVKVPCRWRGAAVPTGFFLPVGGIVLTGLRTTGMALPRAEPVRMLLTLKQTNTMGETPTNLSSHSVQPISRSGIDRNVCPIRENSDVSRG